ncbi:hypothetical protein MTP99_012862 [Tenebrio molitor]|nr:hypothetical protein MTP99_012862 [Tenebrio molitor]
MKVVSIFGIAGACRREEFLKMSTKDIEDTGDATGLRGTFPGHPRPFHLTFTDIHNNIYNIYTPMGALPDGTRTRADLAVVAERVLILPSTTLPRERSRTGSRTPTSGAGRDKFARRGAKDIKGGTDAILEVLDRFSVDIYDRIRCNRCWRTRGGRPKRLEDRPRVAPTVRCGGFRLPTLRVSGSHFATLLGRRHPPGSHQRAGPHTGLSLAEEPEYYSRIMIIIHFVNFTS